MVLKICFISLSRISVRQLLYYYISLNLCNQSSTAELFQTWSLGNGFVCCLSLSKTRNSEDRVNMSKETLELLANEENSILSFLSIIISLNDFWEGRRGEMERT